MSKKSNRKLKWVIPFAVLSVTCMSVGIISGCKDKNNEEEHVHAYEWQHDDKEHWKECPTDKVEEEGSRGEHLFVAGECECGATEVVAVKKYGKVTGTVKLHKNGGYDTDLTGVSIDMGDDVEPSFDNQTGVFTVDNVEVGKNYSLTVSKNGYQSYAVTVQVEKENETVTVGGQRGIVLEYEVFGYMAGYDTEYHDFSHVNDDKPYLLFNENDGTKTLNVMSNDSYTDVAATMCIKYGNSLNNMRTQGIMLRYEDGKHIIVRYHNGDQLNGNIQYVNTTHWAPDTADKTLFGSDANLNQWGENPVHTLTAAETAAIKAADGGLDLTLVVKDGKLTVLFDGKYVSEYQLPDGYAEKKVKVGYFAWNAASGAIFDYGITTELPAMQTGIDIDVTQPDNAGCAVTVSPEKEKYAFGEQVQLNVTAASGYMLSALTVNGEDKFSALNEGKLTLLADRANIEVEATFVAKVDVALNLTVKGKKLGETKALAEGTKVTLSGIADKFTVNAEGKITADAIAKTRYTISVDGYFSKEIVVDENLTEVVLEYDAFKIVRWDAEGHDLSHVNDAEPYASFNGSGSSFNIVSKEQLFDSAVVTMVLKGSCSSDGAKQQGIILQFEDGKAAILNINTDTSDGKVLRLQFRPELFSDGSNPAIGLHTAFDKEWVEFKNVTEDELGKLNSDNGIVLKVYRSETNLYVFLDDVFKGVAELPEKYSDSKMGFGFFSFGAVKDAQWKFTVSDKAADFPALGGVEIKNGTAEGAHGSISFSPANVELGGTVTVTVTPEAGYVLKELTVTGGATVTKVNDTTYTFEVTANEHTVTALFIDPTVTITNTTADDAHGSVSFNTGKIVLGNTVTITVTPDTGYRFVSLTVLDGSSNKVTLTEVEGKYTFVAQDTTYTITATFMDPTVTINDETADDAHGTVTIKEGKIVLDETVEITVTPDAGYLIGTIKVLDSSSKEVTLTQKDGKYTFVAEDTTYTLTVTFVEKVDIELNIPVQGKKLGATSNLAKDTLVTFTRTGSGDEHKLTVGEDGKIVGTLPKGEYTVSADRYFSKTVIVDVSLEGIVLEYDSFKELLGWGSFNFENQNADTPKFGITNDCAVILTKDTYGSGVMASIYLKGENMSVGEGGLVFRFVGDGMANNGEAFTVVMQNTKKVQVSKNDLWGKTTIADDANWSNLIYFVEGEDDNEYRYADEHAAEYLESYAAGELKLSVLREESTFYVFLNGRFVGKQTIADKYKNARCEVGFITAQLGNNSAWKYWEVNIDENVQREAVTINNATAANAGGAIEVANNIKLGDTVVLTVTPEATHLFDKIEISGGANLQLQEDGTYTFVASKTEYTVTATFVEKPENEAEATVSGIGLGNSAIDLNGVKVTVTPAEGAAKVLTVTEGKLKDWILPGEYTLSIEGYYDVKATVGENGSFENLTDGFKFEKIIFVTNGIKEPTGNIFTNGATVSWSADDTHAASTGKITSVQAGKMYEWTTEEYQDVAFTVTLKSGNGNQGILMRFGGEQKDVRLRFENTKAQWIGGNQNSWWWGTRGINDRWDFGTGEEYANTMSATLLNKYNGDGLTLTLARKGGMVYAIIDGKVYSAQSVSAYFDKKVRLAMFVENSKADYEVPFVISTDVDAVLAKAGVAAGSDVTTYLGNWTESEGTLKVSTARGYAEFKADEGTVKESATIHVKESVGGDQGLVYRFADGKYIAVRYQKNGGNYKVQYTMDTPLYGDGSLKNWTDWLMNETEKTAFATNGLDLTFVRDGKFFYTLLGDRLLDKAELDNKYTAMGGAMGIMIWDGKNEAFAYSHAAGDDALAGFSTINVNVKNGEAHGYEVSVDKPFIKNGESVTLTVKTGANWVTAWSFFPNAITVNGEPIDFTTVVRESLGANRCKFTYTLENVTADTTIEVEIAKGTTIENGVVVTVKDEVGGTATSDSGANGYYWNDGCDIYITPENNYEIESITVDDGTPVTSGWTFDSKNSRFVYTLPNSITKPTTVVVAFKEKAPEVTASASIVTDPTDEVTFGADIVETDKTFEVLAYERFGVGKADGAGNTVYTKDDSALIDGSDLTTKSTTAASGSFGGKGYNVLDAEESTVKDGSCYYLSSGDVAVKITKGVAQIRIYVGAWHAEKQQGGTFTLKIGDKVIGTHVYSNNGEATPNGDKQNDVIVFTVDTSALTAEQSVDAVLHFENTHTDSNLPCAGIQVLGEKVVAG